MGVVDPAGKALQEWLRAAMLDAEGKPKMTVNQLVERSGVYKGSLYPILQGKGQNPEDETLRRLAKTLGVQAPRVERRVTFAPAPEPESPLAMLRSAVRLLGKVERELEAEGGRPTKRKPDAGVVDPAAEVALAEGKPRHSGPHRQRRRA